MKIFILLDEIEDGAASMIFGVYTSEEKAREVWRNYKLDPSNNFYPNTILSFELDAPVDLGGEEIA